MEKYCFPENERAVLERSRIPYAIYQFLDNRVVTHIISDGFLELFGYKNRSEAYMVAEHNMYRDTHPDDVARMASVAHRFSTEGAGYDVIYRSPNRERTGYLILHAIGEHFYTESGVRLSQVWYVNEGVYEQDEDLDTANLVKNMYSSLHVENARHTSYFDYLTGLPSMSYFYEIAEEKKNQCLESGRHPAIVFLDMSGMKYYNRKHGFNKGDRLIREISRHLSSYFNSENCSRLGQDHFAVLTKEEGLTDALNQLFEEFRKMTEGEVLVFRAGIYLFSMENVNVGIACDRAKVACDELRGNYISAFNFYNTTMQIESDKKQYIISHLDEALEKEYIEVYYQPIVRAISGYVCDEEALARWNDPERGFLYPGDFIPILENAGLIYKLDLYMVKKVLSHIKRKKAAGLYAVPQSVNLSRSDFDVCDIVEEVRELVDASGLGRDCLSIEITESTVGKDFEFMKEQIRRFRELGFPVWMDDFGSGYSSLDVLQSIEFDLIKFDMLFMRQFNDGDSSRIILTELMKMATDLGIDTICEGVETVDQVHFLKEIGCSKLQGYFFAKPMPIDNIFERYRNGTQIGYEDPKQEAYYRAVGRINLYDLSVIAREATGEFQNFFNTLPMAVIEIQGDMVRFLRSNPSYREFMERRFGICLTNQRIPYSEVQKKGIIPFVDVLRNCCDHKNKAFFDEELEDGSWIHSFIRRISDNPVTGTTAVVTVVLSITNESLSH